MIYYTMKSDITEVGRVLGMIFLAVVVIAAIASLIYAIASPAPDTHQDDVQSVVTYTSNKDAHKQIVRYCESAIININSANRDNVACYRAAKYRNAISNLYWACEYERDSVNIRKINEVMHALKYAVLILEGEKITEDSEIDVLWLINNDSEGLSGKILSKDDVVPVDETAYINNAILYIANVINNQPK